MKMPAGDTEQADAGISVDSRLVRMNRLDRMVVIATESRILRENLLLRSSC